MWKENRQKWSARYTKQIWAGRYEYKLVILDPYDDSLKGYFLNPVSSLHSPNLFEEGQFYSSQIAEAQIWLENHFNEMKKGGKYLLVTSQIDL